MKRTFLAEFAPAFFGLSASQFVLTFVVLAVDLPLKRALVHFSVGAAFTIPAVIGFYQRRRS